ncbi:MAG: iron chelate uptake ABC transporter family permease subunit, partial [Anaerolineales bacterium]|nr:iron chelate uptake ABC transporter family permease subunit [Anaerolineales bacterium]
MKTTSHIYLIALGLLAGTFLLSVVVGAVFIPLNEMLAVFMRGVASSEAYSSILLKVRIPHTVLILITGAALGGSGAAYQGLFRNPLADPYLIGVASGASLGAVFAMSANWPNGLLGFYAIPVAAFVGSVVTVFL